MQKYLQLIYSNIRLIIFTMIIIIISFILIINNHLKNNNLAVTNKENTKFREEYEILNNEKTSDGIEYPEVNLIFNNIEYLTIDEALDILNNGTAVIYVGYAECLYCRSAIQVLVDTAKDMDLEAIYYLDISEIWDIKELDENNNIITTKEAHEKYNNLLEELNDNHLEKYILNSQDGTEFDTEELRVKVPLVIFVVDGNIVSSNVGTLFSQESPYDTLNEDQVRGLGEIYHYGIRDVLEGLKYK